MDSYLNGRKVDVLNPLDLIGVGRHKLEIQVDKKNYWNMFKEQLIVPTPPNNGVSNLFRGGEILPSEVYNDNWYKTFAFYAFQGQSTIERKNDLYPQMNYFKFANATGTADIRCNQFEREVELKPNTRYTWQFNAKKIKGNMLTLFGVSDSVLIDNTKDVTVDGEKGVKVGEDAGYNWSNKVKDDTWGLHYMSFTTASTLPTSKTFRFQMQANSEWHVKNIQITEGNGPKPFQLSEADKYKYTQYQMDKGHREVYPNFGFYYSEEFDFCCAYKVNIHSGFETTDFNPIEQSYTISCEVENFAQILNPVREHYIKVPSSCTFDNSILMNPTTEYGGNYLLECKAKGMHLEVFEQPDGDYSRSLNRKVYAELYNNLQTNAWNVYGGYVFTGELQTYEIEN
ncbi:capsid and scaffold protein [Lactococcus phage CHPC966]|uniref:Capsid and scaffold protein n=1 Tax=Lactococcus phage CHPC966 TaxID=2675258 RepID=A0A650EU16_9CAUD|nr:virion structural protein [Lactococcus phage CHPC966]QGT53436.1 capsid and scaffold protein [Lactococcus phage CHPC966]